MIAFFWVLWILTALAIMSYVVRYVCTKRELIKTKRRLNQNQFELQCWRAKLRRETEPTGIVTHKLNGHHYIAVSHGLAEVPALYLSMRRMMMEVESEEGVLQMGFKQASGRYTVEQSFSKD